MEIQVKEIEVQGERYCVVHPCPCPRFARSWILLDADGNLVCNDRTVDQLRCSDEYIDELDEAADAACETWDGEPLEELLESLPSSALEALEDIGWIVRYGPSSTDVLLPDTPVFVREYIPSRLREKARRDVWAALQVLGTCIREWDADPVSVFESIPEDVEGFITTAAELAAV